MLSEYAMQPSNLPNCCHARCWSGCACCKKRRIYLCKMFSCCLFLIIFLTQSVSAGEYFDQYGLSPGSLPVDLGVQPLGYPSGVISVVMQHDRILQRALKNSNTPLKTHPFKRGADMVALLADKRLEAGLIGDMPTILAAASGHVFIAGLVKQATTSIVAREGVRIDSLAGKRIGYVEASSAHHTLLQGLVAAGVKGSQVTLIPISIADMPEALARGQIDAFSAWEPAPSIALGQNPENHVIFRGVSTDYFVLERNFVKRSPELALQLLAGFVRAVEWMRRSQHNAEKAVRWAIADAEKFSGKSNSLSVKQIVMITHREILDIPSAPVILLDPASPPLQKQFQFLQSLNKLPTDASWENLKRAMHYDGLPKIFADRQAYQLRSYDYEE